MGEESVKHLTYPGGLNTVPTVAFDSLNFSPKEKFA